MEKKRPKVVANVEFTVRMLIWTGIPNSLSSGGTVSGSCVLTCRRRVMYEHPPLGFVSQAKLKEVNTMLAT